MGPLTTLQAPHASGEAGRNCRQPEQFLPGSVERSTYPSEDRIVASVGESALVSVHESAAGFDLLQAADTPATARAPSAALRRSTSRREIFSFTEASFAPLVMGAGA